MGLTGLEPVTLRLSSACSNQLSYRPGIAAAPRNFRISIADFRFGTTGAFRAHLLKSTIANRKSKMQYQDVRLRHGFGTTAPKAFGAGGKGITLPLVHPKCARIVGFCLHAFQALEARGFEPLTSSLQSWRSTN